MFSQAQGDVVVREPRRQGRTIIKSMQLSSSGSNSNDQKFIEHSVIFSRIWSSERESKGRCAFCRKQVSDINLSSSLSSLQINLWIKFYSLTMYFISRAWAVTKFVVSGGRFVLMGKYGCLIIQISIKYSKAEDCYRKII